MFELSVEQIKLVYGGYPSTISWTVGPATKAKTAAHKARNVAKKHKAAKPADTKTKKPAKKKTGSAKKRGRPKKTAAVVAA